MVWINEVDGILEGIDVLLWDGKIVAIGQGLKARGVMVIDVIGFYFMFGIIDEYFYIVISWGVNESL